MRQIRGTCCSKQLDTDVLRDFRQQWKDEPLAGRKKLERLRAFFRFATEAGWVSSNPALPIRPPLLHDNSTMPLDDDELERTPINPDLVGISLSTTIRMAAGSSTLRRLLHQDAIRPWYHRTWIFPRGPN